MVKYRFIFLVKFYNILPVRSYQFDVLVNLTVCLFIVYPYALKAGAEHVAQHAYYTALFLKDQCRSLGVRALAVDSSQYFTRVFIS